MSSIGNEGDRRWAGPGPESTGGAPLFAPVVSPRRLAALAAMSLLLGFAIRGPIVLTVDFPLNDGGLFLEFVDAILAGNFAFPRDIEWNGHRIPFAYPPLSFYAVAALSSAIDVDPLKLFQYVPLIFNLVALPLFVWLAARLMPTPSSVFFAAVAYPIVPRSYEWLIMGGGVSRSPAMVGMLVAMLLTMEAIDRRRPRLLVATTIVLGIVLTLHLEWAISAWVATALLLLVAGPTTTAVARAVGIGAGMGLVALPWWGSVIAIHGIEPYVAAMTTGGWDAETLVGRITNFDLFTLPGSWFAVAAAFGVAFACHSRDRRQVLVIAWLLSIYATTPRHAKSVAALPAAMLVGLSLSALAGRMASLLRRAADGVAVAPASPPHGLVVALLHMVLAASLCADMAWEVEHRPTSEQSPLVALTPDERAGMAWIAANVDEGARFLVASPALGWAWDREAEWFPLLAARQSANTLQGLEWVRDVSFESELTRSDMHRQAAYVSPSIAPQLGLQLFGPAHDHVAVFAPRGAPIRLSYAQSEIYETIHEQEGMGVYRMRPEVRRSLTLQTSAASIP